MKIDTPFKTLGEITQQKKTISAIMGFIVDNNVSSTIIKLLDINKSYYQIELEEIKQFNYLNNKQFVSVCIYYNEVGIQIRIEGNIKIIKNKIFLYPGYFEFWYKFYYRLHKRICYKKNKFNWDKKILFP